MKEPIRKVKLKDGTIRYRLGVDIGRDEHGKRQQLTCTFEKLNDGLPRDKNPTSQTECAKLPFADELVCRSSGNAEDSRGLGDIDYEREIIVRVNRTWPGRRRSRQAVCDSDGESKSSP